MCFIDLLIQSAAFVLEVFRQYLVVYLGSFQIAIMGLLCEYSLKGATVIIFRKEPPSKIFYRVLNTPVSTSNNQIPVRLLESLIFSNTSPETSIGTLAKHK